MKSILSGFILKLSALVLMIIDHVGLVIFAGTSLYLPCRILGRIAFPIYAFLITEGYVHTRNVKKYGLRLLLFAFLSEIPFDYAFFGTFFYLNYQNVFFTLSLGLAALVCFDVAAGNERAAENERRTFKSERIDADKKEIPDWSRQVHRSNIAKALLILIVILAEMGHTDYGSFGIVMILLFYWLRNQKAVCVLATSAALIGYGFLGGFQVEGFGALAWIFIGLYNGKKGWYPLPSILFYAAYPIHLLILGIIERGLPVLW